MRSMRADHGALVNPDTRTLEVTFSSESPVRRWWGDEILSHAPGAADLARLNDGAPLLFNHNMNDVIGVVQGASVGKDKRGHATVRFAKTPRADEIVGMINDGVLRNISFLYEVDNYVAGGASSDGQDTFTADSWRVFEISIVSVPADQSIGIGRAFNTNKDFNMNEPEQLSRGQRRAASHLEAANQSAAEAEALRLQEIMSIGRRHDDERLARELALHGASVAQVRAAFFERLNGHPQAPVAVFQGQGAHLDMHQREVDRFSIVRAINATVTGDWSSAGFERECSQAVAKQLGRASRGFFVPADVQRRGNWQARTPYVVGTPSYGGNLVEQQLLADQFIEALRPAAQVMAAGATVLSGLVGNVDIPRRNGTTSTYWVGEGQRLTEGESTFDKVTLTPKTVGAISRMSRLTLLQTTPDIEMLTRYDLTRQIGLAVDQAALVGTGTNNQPTGVLNPDLVGSPYPIVGGPNGAAITFENLIDLETQVGVSNPDPATFAYFMNSKTVGTLKKIRAETGQFLWTQGVSGQRSGTPNTYNGSSVYVTNQMPSNLSKGSAAGVCSAVLFGAWSDLLIGMWGILEIVANPFDSDGFPAGDVLIRAMQTIDISVRHGSSFSRIVDALTP